MTTRSANGRAAAGGAGRARWSRSAGWAGWAGWAGDLALVAGALTLLALAWWGAPVATAVLTLPLALLVPGTALRRALLGDGRDGQDGRGDGDERVERLAAVLVLGVA